MGLHRRSGSGNPNQQPGRHGVDAHGNRDRYPLGQPRRVTRDNNQIEDRRGNDPHHR